MGQTGRRSIATHILAVKIALGAAPISWLRGGPARAMGHFGEYSRRKAKPPRTLAALPSLPTSSVRHRPPGERLPVGVEPRGVAERGRVGAVCGPLPDGKVRVPVQVARQRDIGAVWREGGVLLPGVG